MNGPLSSTCPGTMTPSLTQDLLLHQYTNLYSNLNKVEVRMINIYMFRAIEINTNEIY